MILDESAVAEPGSCGSFSRVRPAVEANTFDLAIHSKNPLQHSAYHLFNHQSVRLNRICTLNTTKRRGGITNGFEHIAWMYTPYILQETAPKQRWRRYIEVKRQAIISKNNELTRHFVLLLDYRYVVSLFD